MQYPFKSRPAEKKPSHIFSGARLVVSIFCGSRDRFDHLRNRVVVMFLMD